MIVNRQRTVRLARRPLELFLGRVRDELGLGAADVTVCFVSDAEIARMNESYRKKKWPTVRLRRGVTVVKAGEYLGDIAISPSTARRYAKKSARTLPSELRVLILHGVLHLLGYDHETDRGEMNRIERRLRKRFGLA